MSTPKRWTADELAMLLELYPTHPTKEVARRLGRTYQQVKTQASNYGLIKTSGPHARHLWTDAELAQLRREYPHGPTEELAAKLGLDPERVYRKAWKLGLRKSKKYLARLKDETSRALRRSGARHRFKPGHVPANKGVKGWDAGGRSRETQFKPGRMPQTWQPIGTVRRRSDGYWVMKVSDEPVPSRFNWTLLHHLLWEAHNGPIPEGHLVVFRDGNANRILLENLELITRAENARRNSIHRYPPEVRDVMRLRGRLRRAIKEAEDEKQDRGPAESPVRDNRGAQGSG